MPSFATSIKRSLAPSCLVLEMNFYATGATLKVVLFVAQRMIALQDEGTVKA